MGRGEKGPAEGRWARFRREVLIAGAEAPRLAALPTEGEVRWAKDILDRHGWDAP
jgi:hypothetical protein